MTQPPNACLGCHSLVNTFGCTLCKKCFDLLPFGGNRSEFDALMDFVRDVARYGGCWCEGGATCWRCRAKLLVAKIDAI